MTRDQDSGADALARERLRFDAMVKNDVAGLSDMFADDLVYTHSSSIVHDKRAYLAALRNGEFGYDDVRTSEEKVVCDDDVAIIVGKVVIDATFPQGPRRIRSRFMSVWTRDEHVWRHVAWHSTPLPSS